MEPTNPNRESFELQGQAEVTLEAAAEGQPPKRPTFSITAYTGVPMSVGWGRPVVVDLAGLKSAGRVAVLLDHDYTQIVGQGEAAIGEDKVVVAGVVTGDFASAGDPAQKVVAHARNGFRWGASVGVQADQIESIAEGVVAKVNGRNVKGPVLVVRAGVLKEVSFVSVAADERASAKVAAKAAEENHMADEAKPNVEAGGQTPPGGPAPSEKQTPDAAAEMRASAALEAKRIAELRKVCAGNEEVLAKALGENWTAEKAELEVLRASRPAAPAVHVGGWAPADAQVLTAAGCLSGKLEKAEKSFDAKVLEAADKRFGRSMGLGELLLEFAWRSGYSRPNIRNVKDVLTAAFSQTDIGGILSNIANKFLLEGFESVESTWREIAAIRSVRDFKTVTSYRLTGGLEYQEVAPTGELKHGALGEESMTNKADTYGLMLSLSRQDIVNDDLGALTAVPRRLGRGGALKLNSVFWTAFLNNAAFFTTGRKNYAEGAATALGLDALTAAELLFLNQTDADGKPLGATPRVLLVPNALNVQATHLMNSLEIRDTTGNTKYPTSNPHAGKFRPVRSSYLSNASISGYSAKAWYLLADPADLAVIEAAFLNGQESPTVETAEADFNVLGVQMRGYHDFGVALQEYRAGVKMKGEA